MPFVTAVCRVHQLIPDSGTVGVTAIDKRPVTDPLRVRPLGLHGDVQANRKHHGGEDQAVYAYADEDAAYFSTVLGRPVEPGLFGENLRTSGIEVSTAVVGERWRVGDGLVLEVTLPRVPCATFARRMKVDKWVRTFTDANRTGAYLRVVRSGAVQAGDRIERFDRPAHGITVADVFAGLGRDQAVVLLEGGRGLPYKIEAVARKVLSGVPASL
ncbi:MOSC domain-containing protein [Curtobacterium sp. MCBD17_034]|uniref:MOSC domain-containing protein n=1 Tax=unclassified Curtobacterium TaxID=257496 RepID=UPI000DA9CA46|nr:MULTISPECIES: MOSC domain-containing protein [unclassified Curtobacterium]PZF56231.1 MOSC domain-containing protein [Curtobacterium sp. MCBD17_034]PZM32864.1 MOSC domain-containing protein [Curtobacterium sp. MCBD17_031]